MKMNTLNWDLEYTKDIESGNGFDIWDTVGIDTKTKQRTEHGLFSP